MDVKAKEKGGKIAVQLLFVKHAFIEENVGQALTNWTENHSSSHTHSDYNDTTTYGCEINYIYEYAILWQSPDGSNILPAGEYTFSFTVKIPYGVPPTFYGEYGNVKYFIRTIIDIPWDFDQERIVDFTVLAYVDLNIDQRLSLQAHTDAIENIYQYCSCKTNPIILKVSIPKSGYVSGEKVSISVNIVNKSFSKITSVEAKLIRGYLFLGNMNACPSHPSSNCRSKGWDTEEFNQSFDPPADGITSVYTITVPMLPPSYLLCSIIKFYYSIVVKVHTDALFSSGPKVRIPIIIGTVPIQETVVLPATPSTPNVSENAAAKTN